MHDSKILHFRFPGTETPPTHVEHLDARQFIDSQCLLLSFKENKWNLKLGML